MKKHLLFIAFGLCALLLSACASYTSSSHASAREVANDMEDNKGLTPAAEPLYNEIRSTETDVTQDKHRTAVWSHGTRTAKSVLIVHGLHESPFYMRSFALHFYNQGYNVVSMLMPGHQRNAREALNTVSHLEWVAQTEKALALTQELGESVEFLGYSTGGTLGVYYTLKKPGLIKKLYLIAPALALNTKINLAGRLIGWTGLDTETFCTRENMESWGCVALFYTDDQLQVMVKEGLQSSPAAGLEVQRLINLTINEFGTSNDRRIPNRNSYFNKLKRTYEKLKLPVLMVNTDNDNVVMPRFNDNLMKKYKGFSRTVFYPKNEGISHITINKSALDAFETNPEYYNHEFPQLLQKLDEVMAY